MNHRIAISCLALIALAWNGCSSTSPTAPETPWSADSAVCNVTYTDNTVYFDSTHVGDIVGHDTSTNTFAIKQGSTLSSRLVVGNYLLTWRQGMGKISSVTPSGSNLLVALDSCTLDNIVKDGTISFDYGIDFNPSKVIFPTVFAGKHGNEVMSPVSTDSFGIRLDYSDYIYKIALKLKQESAYVKIGVEKKLLQGFRASFTAEGNIQRFRQKSTMRFSNSQLQQFDHVNSHMQGDLKLSIAAAGSANDALNFEVPIVVAKYPVAVGPFVFFINVKIQVVANCVVPPEASSLVDVRFKYDSDLGFTYDGINASPFGREGTESMEKDGNMTTAAAQAVAANFGVGFPRMELDLLGIGLVVPYVQPGFTVGGDYTTGIHPCMRGNAAFIGAAGVNMGYAGMTLKKSFTLWNKQKTLVKSGDCP